MPHTLFPLQLTERQWQQFPADGFSQACGVIFRPGQAVCGLPLGGIGTGCTDLNTDGTLGRTSIFNSFTPPREQKIPFLALASGGQAWTLASEAAPGTAPAQEIRYWGHYPIADLEYALDGSLSVGLRAWAPFILGDSIAANTPAAMFEVRVRNLTAKARPATIALTFPGFSQEEGGEGPVRRRGLNQGLRGLEVTGARASYALAALDMASVRLGGALVAERGDYARIASKLPPASAREPGATLAVDLALEPNSETVVRFILAWHAPQWSGTFYRDYLQFYSQRFVSAADALRHLAREHQSLLARILAWQQAIFAREELPVWLRDQLVNILHTIAEDSFWAANSIPPDDWCRQGGIFGLTESPRSVPHVAIPSDFYGSLPFVFFFPDLLRQLLRAYKHYQLASGEIPLGVGWGADLGSPIYGFLHTTNCSTYIDLVHRLWARERDEAVLREFYPSVKAAVGFLQSLDRDGDGLLDLDPWPTGNQFYGAWHWVGTATHTNGFFVAALKMAEAMAEAMDDRAFAHDCRLWFKQASQALAEKLWTGDYYLLYTEPATGQQSDTILANQLVGHLLARMHGLASAFPADCVRRTLATIKRHNLPPARHGMYNAIRPDGTIDETGPTHSTHMFTGEAIAVAATLLFEGDRRAGLKLAEKVMANLVLRQGLGWDPPNQIDPVSGQATYGTDFYQMMILWLLPLGVLGKDMGALCGEGGMIREILTPSPQAAVPVPAPVNGHQPRKSRRVTIKMG